MPPKIQDIITPDFIKQNIGKRIEYNTPGGQGSEVFKIADTGLQSLGKVASISSATPKELLGAEYTLGLANPAKEGFALTPKDFSGDTSQRFLGVQDVYRPQEFKVGFTPAAPTPFEIAFKQAKESGGANFNPQEFLQKNTVDSSGNVIERPQDVGIASIPGEPIQASEFSEPKITFKSGFTGDKSSIVNMLKDRKARGTKLNETDAKNYAYSIGESNWQQFVGLSADSVVGWQAKKTEATTGLDVTSKPDTSAIDKSAKMNEMLLKVQESYKKAGGNSTANSAFIQSVAQAKFGRPASEKELKSVSEGGMVGASLTDVVTAFGLSDKVSGLGVISKEEEGKTKDQTIKDLQAKVDAGGVLSDIDKKNWNYATGNTPLPTKKIEEKPEEKKEESTNPILDAYNNLIKAKEGQIEGEVAIDPILKIKQDAETEVEKARQVIADKDLIDAVKLEGISKNQPIPMSIIRKQQGQYSADEYIENLMNTQDYNNKVILSQIASGNLMEAQRINQQIASDKFELGKLMIDKLEAEGRIDAQSKDTLYKQAEYELGLSEAGYTPLESQSAIDNARTQYGESRLWQDPVSKQYYLKPDKDAVITSTINVDGQLWGVNAKGDKVKNYGKTSSFEFKANDDGSVNIYNPSTGEVVRNEKPENATLSIGDGIITGMNGSDKWAHGLDFVLSGGKGAEVSSPTVGEVIFAGTNGGFGNQVKIRIPSVDSYGNFISSDKNEEVWFSHLNNIDVNVGDVLNVGDIIGGQGNTGNVYSLTGGDGTHLDITMKKSDGTYYKPQEVAGFLGYKKDETYKKLKDLTETELKYVNTVQDNARVDDGIKMFNTVRGSYEQGRSAYNQNDGLGDIVLMRTIAKITDPTSAVREEEFKTFEDAQATLQRFGVKITKKWWKGDRLSEFGRNQMIATLDDIYEQRKSAYENSISFFQNQLAGRGIDPELATPYYVAPEEKSEGQYKIGDIVSRGEKQYKVVDFDKDGEPLVDLIK